MCLNYYILNTMIFMILLQKKKSSIYIFKSKINIILTISRFLNHISSFKHYFYISFKNWI